MSSKWKAAPKRIYHGVKKLWTEYHFLVPPSLWKSYVLLLWRRLKNEKEIKPFLEPSVREDYSMWVKFFEEKPKYERIRFRPVISLLMPVFDVDEKVLRESIKSIMMQKYKYFEICIVGDESNSVDIKNALGKYRRNKKIKVAYLKNDEMVTAFSKAFNMARGDYIALMDAGDILAKNALYEVAKVLNCQKDLDLIYSDEDEIDSDGKRLCPHFKPDWSPDTLLGLNYIHRLAVIKTENIKKVGGFVPDMENAQDYDLFLKVTEKTDRVYHIPKILYHRRNTEKMVENEALYEAERKAIMKALKRRGVKAKVEKGLGLNCHLVMYELEKEPMVSIIVPTKDYAEVTETCLKSIYKRTKYKNYEVIVVNNRSEEEVTYKLFDKYKKKYKNFRVIDADMEFNYSKINNLAVKQAKGEVVILLNNDTEVLTSEWMAWMVGYALQSHVGAVGAKLLYPDDKIQHAGVILGLGQSRVAGHAYVDKSREELGVDGRLCVPYNYSAVTAACLCIEKKKYEEVGGLDEKMKIAFNDVDFNMKLLDKGYYNVFLPMIELYHFESRSRGLDTSPEKQERFEREMALMKKKWKEKLVEDKYYNANLSLDCSFVLKRKEENGRKR